MIGARWLTWMALALAATGGFAAPPKPKRVAPRPMPPLTPAVIDDTLAITGEDIDARKVSTRMTVAVQVNGRGPYRFVVDSGADTSVVGMRLAATLRLPPGRPVIVNGMTESAVVQRARVAELTLGRNILHDRELPVLKEVDLGGDGMIGIDSLAEQRLMLDFEKRLITVEDAKRPPPRLDGEIVVIARRRRGQLILTQVSANRKPLDAVIDTGSEITVGNIALRDLLLGPHGHRYAVPVEIIGVTGRPLTLQIARISELRLGPVLFRDIPIAFADLPPFEVFGLAKQPALLLGTDLMEKFRRVSLDFRARRVRFQLRRCESTGITISAAYTSRLGLADRQSEACRR